MIIKMDKIMEIDKEKYEKKTAMLENIIEKKFGIRTIHTYQCIKCGVIMKEIEEAGKHVLTCEAK